MTDVFMLSGREKRGAERKGEERKRERERESSEGGCRKDVEDVLPGRATRQGAGLLDRS
jgi:hypothetical protein